MVKDLGVVLGKGRKSRTCEKNIWKKRSIFWDLPYCEPSEGTYGDACTRFCASASATHSRYHLSSEYMLWPLLYSGPTG